LTSGGILLAKAKELGLDYIQVPNTGQPPRACLGYSFVQQLVILKYFGFAPANCIEQVKKGITSLENAQNLLRKEAQVAAKKMHNKFPVIYTTGRMEPVGLRFRQQLNENAKILCVHHSVPEMNHNELVGWREQSGDFVAMIFRSADNTERNRIRIDTCKEIIGQYAEIIEFSCLGESLIEQALYGVHYGDWISYEMAVLREIDPVEVKAIDLLKGRLAEAVL
jgi:glucose/mannose-6-phosphate isomerase